MRSPSKNCKRHREPWRDVRLRCLFLEGDGAAFQRLKAYADQCKGIEIRTINSALESAVPEILGFVNEGGRASFPFLFIDPTGWAGFGMDVIAPLLQLNPGEVLINFMMGHIRRFIDSPEESTRASFERLFGAETFREDIAGLAGEDLDAALVERYASNIKKVGGFTFTSSCIVLNPQKDQTHCCPT